MSPSDDTLLADLTLSVRLQNVLAYNADIRTCGEARAMSDRDLLRCKNLGRKHLEELRAALAPDPYPGRPEHWELNGECIMLMRQHLEGVGIHAAFADDCAMLAAHEIRHLRDENGRLHRVLAHGAGAGSTVGVPR